MKISAINSINNQTPRMKKDLHNVTFGAGVPAAAAENAVKAAKKMPWVARALMYVGQNDGEILNTLVTAFGTAVIAPILIAGNPISKEDKETKWYSAMRQPISAVIAMIMQIGVANVYNGYMARCASRGEFGPNMDLRAKPDGKWLKKIISVEDPNLSGKELSDEITLRQIKAEKIQLAKLRKEMQGKAINPDDLISIKAMSEAENELRAEYESTYKEMMEGKKIRKGKDKRNQKRFIESNLFEKRIKERARQNVQKEIEFEAQVKFEISKLKTKFAGRKDAIDLAIKRVKSDKKLNKDVIEKIVEKLEKVKAYEAANGKAAFSSLPNLGTTLEEITHNVKVKKLLKARTAAAQRFFKNFRNIGGLLVAMLTLPISCGILNWAYPRVMEKVMPKLQPWIHRNNPDWSPETAKKYGPPPAVKKEVVKVVEEGKNA